MDSETEFNSTPNYFRAAAPFIFKFKRIIFLMHMKDLIRN